MASIDASTSGAGGIITTADNTGTLQLKSGGTTIATISSTGLALNAGNITLPSSAAPAFSVYQTSSQTGISAGTVTKITFDTEEFDTNNNFASSRFTPTVAGYYQLSGGVQTGGASTVMFLELFKNGSVYKRFGNSSSSNVSQLSGSSLIYLNGSTDYAELYFYIATGTSTDNTNQARTYFNGVMVRSA